MFFFLFSCGGGGGGRGHLKCLRLQPGAGAGEKLSNEKGVIIILLVLSHQTPPGPLPHKKNKECLEQ